jgi:regulator of RNase E activity RraA/CMP-N-acetylneuraminic acid synthetase
MNIVAFVPAKGHSERVASKNLRVLDGEHLFKRKLRQALDCPAVTEVVLDTDSDAIAALADDLPVACVKRPADLATNATDGHELFAWQCAQRPDADLWIQILCTAPFVSADTIGRAIAALLADPEADSLVAVTSAKQYCWSETRPLYGNGRIPNSVDLAPTVIEAMSLYIVRRGPDGAVPTRRFGTRPILFDLDPIELIDINHDSDLVIAETVAAGQRAKEVTRFRAMLPHLSSTVLADICKDRGMRVLLPPELRPTSGGKLLGRARTLELTGLADPSDRESGEWKGIYDALQSYQFVRPGDVIMVATDVPHRAYFGDLNANLAIRSGAVGAIIDGTTRDTADVRALGFPVYARRSHCDDIKFEGTVKSMNKPVRMGNVEVANGDVVFADEDGVIVVRAADWDAIEAAAWDVMANEARIRMFAARGRDVNEILAECGAF